MSVEKKKCCTHGRYSDTGLYARGHHTHARKTEEFDNTGSFKTHATGYKFQKDASTTKAVLNRMRSLGLDV